MKEPSNAAAATTITGASHAHITAKMIKKRIWRIKLVESLLLSEIVTSPEPGVEVVPPPEEVSELEELKPKLELVVIEEDLTSEELHIFVH